MAKCDFIKLRLEVKRKFNEIKESLNIREKLLLRQADLLIHSSSNITAHPLLNEVSAEFLTDNEDELLKQIRNFGKFNYDSMNIAFSDVFKNEDYNDPKIDHETMYKCLREECAIADQLNANTEQIMVDLSNNRRLLQDSIINITVNETKKLIEREENAVEEVDPLNLRTTYISPTDSQSTNTNKSQDDNKTSTTKSSQTEVPAKKKRSFRPKITINNCNGIINLRNIANLTINCAKESSILKEKSSRDHSSSNGKEEVIVNEVKREEETISSTTRDSEDVEGNCEFYNRLLNEIKNSLMMKKSHTSPPLGVPGETKSEESIKTPDDEEVQIENDLVTPTPDSTKEFDIGVTVTNDQKYVLKNFENLKVVLENVSGTEFHPIQIEQWLAEIISETEIEPNTGETFEYSEITP